MSELRKAAQQALEALEMEATSPPITETGAAIEALRAALAQPEPEPEPVAWINEHGHIDRGWDAILDPTGWTPLYTAPPQRKPLDGEKLEQEPFGWLYESKAGVRIFHFVSDNEPLVQADWEAAQQHPEAHKMTPLYLHPPQRKPLTDEEIWRNDEVMECNAHIGAQMNELMRLVRAIETAHGIGGEE
jgi:hypothetical protein